MSCSLQISTVSIAGRARQGKSYALSRLLNTTDGFTLGHTLNPGTYGVWIGTQALVTRTEEGATVRVLLLDCEGVDHLSARDGQDMALFAITILLSEVLIYNSLGVPKRNDFSLLELFSRVAGSVSTRRNERVAEKYETLQRHFPHLVWFFRDSHLDVPADCASMTDVRRRACVCGVCT